MSWDGTEICRISAFCIKVLLLLGPLFPMGVGFGQSVDLPHGLPAQEAGPGGCSWHVVPSECCSTRELQLSRCHFISTCLSICHLPAYSEWHSSPLATAALAVSTVSSKAPAGSTRTRCPKT